MNFKSERYKLFVTTLPSSGEIIEVQVIQVRRESGRLVGAEPITAEISAYWADSLKKVYIIYKTAKCLADTQQ